MPPNRNAPPYFRAPNRFLLLLGCLPNHVQVAQPAARRKTYGSSRFREVPLRRSGCRPSFAEPAVLQQMIIKIVLDTFCGVQRRAWGLYDEFPVIWSAQQDSSVSGSTSSVLDAKGFCPQFHATNGYLQLLLLMPSCALVSTVFSPGQSFLT